LRGVCCYFIYIDRHQKLRFIPDPLCIYIFDDDLDPTESYYHHQKCVGMGGYIYIYKNVNFSYSENTRVFSKIKKILHCLQVTFCCSMKNVIYFIFVA